MINDLFTICKKIISFNCQFLYLQLQCDACFVVAGKAKPGQLLIMTGGKVSDRRLLIDVLMKKKLDKLKQTSGKVTVNHEEVETAEEMNEITSYCDHRMILMENLTPKDTLIFQVWHHIQPFNSHNLFEHS